MVAKLMKHELVALFRILVWFMLAVLLLGTAVRLLNLVLESVNPEEFNLIVYLSEQSAVGFWMLSVLALAAAGTVLCIVRYFRSLFTGQGYLTFSLPVTPTQLLVAKFLASLIATAACSVVIVLSVIIVYSGPQLSQLFATVSEILPMIFAFLESDPLLIVEAVLIGVALIPFDLLYLFLIASIGQLFTKGRIAITIGLYYGSSFVVSTVLTSFVLPLFVLAEISPHILLWLVIAALYGFDVGSFFLIRHILRRRVNLVV